MIEMVNGEVVITLDPNLNKAQLRVSGNPTHMDIMLDILAHRAKIVGKWGQYTKCQYDDGSVLVSSIYDIYVAVSEEANCWCHDRVLHDAGLCDPSKRKKSPQRTGV